jgi:diguanylate cyclase (GGDEF)-like protein/putative nucleotidyltransferase with HDIG domain
MWKKAGNFRVALSVGLMVASTMWIANTLGWFPNLRQVELNRRLQLANSLALPVSQHIQRQRLPEIEALLKTVLVRHPEFESAGWRTRTGRLLVDAGQHRTRWNDDVSDPKNLSIDVTLGGQPAGALEFRLADIPELSVWYAYTVYPGPMIYGTAFGCILLSWFVLSRAARRNRNRPGSLACVQSAFDALTEAIFMVDRKGYIVLHNVAYGKLTGQSDGVLTDPAGLRWLSPSGGQSVAVLPWQASLVDGLPRNGAVIGLEQAGQNLKLLRVNTVPVQVKNGHPTGVMVSLEDITIEELQRTEMVRVMADLRTTEAEIKLKNAELQFLATSDALTGCLNRRSFYQTYDDLIATEQFAPCSLIMCDIDHFKRVNDQHGHATGDLVLKHVGMILRGLAPNSQWVFRLGGEEFCILLPQINARSAFEIAEAIREAVAENPLEGLSVTASFGLMTLAYDDPSPDILLENADRALYYSKHEGRNRVTHYDSLPEVQGAAKTCSLGPELTTSTPTLSYSAVTALMKTLAYREPGTASHSVRVANLCVRTAKRLLPAAEVQVLEAAALLHDIGKIGIPDSILLKPDRLTAAEWEIMDEHDRYSREILRAAFGSADVIRVVECHHAFFGRSHKGLPTGRAIPLGSRVLSICDAYDAMVNDRVYRKACSHTDALAELRRCAPEQFDPEIVEVFAQCVREGQVMPDESGHGEFNDVLTQLAHLDHALAESDFTSVRQHSRQLAEQMTHHSGLEALQEDFSRLHQSLDQESLQWLDLQEQAHEIVEHCRAAQDTLLTHDFCHRVERSVQQLMRPNNRAV